MVRIPYLVRVFSSGINDFLKVKNAPAMTNVQIDLSPFRRRKKRLKLEKLYEKIVV